MKTSLQNIKNDIADKVLEQLNSIGYMSVSDREAYMTYIEQRLNEQQLVTTVRKQEGITDADAYNMTAFELYLDLLTTFGYVDRLYSTIDNHQKLNESIINSLFSLAGELSDRLDEYASVIGTNGSPYCKSEGFRTQNEQEWDRKYYTERYGERVPVEAFARFNHNQETLTLNYTRQQNVMVYKSGVQLGEILLTKQYGAGFITAKNSETKLENCIDTSGSTYWAETILSDAEIKVVGLGFENNDGLGQTNRSYYNLTRGALCEICFNFESLAKVNEVILKPFGTYPIDIIAIRYSLTDDEEDDIYDVITPENDNDMLTSKSIDKEYAYRFHEIICKRLYILINQVHFIKDTYLIDANKMFKNTLWFNSTYSETSKAVMDETTVFKGCYVDLALESPIWRYINNKMVTNKHIDINDLLINNEHKMLPKTKYQYTYGFYNIAPNFVEFQKAGVWVSKEIVVNGAIDTIKLSSEEEHYKTSDGTFATDVEFYITSKSNPTYLDWKPICPINKDYVHKELLQLDYDYCYLRHTAVCRNIETNDEDGNEIITMERPVVYYNDIIMVEDADYILRFNDDGNVYAIDIPNIDRFALYTVSYTPTDSSKEVSLVEDASNPVPNNTFEEIMGNGGACYQLEGYPYYNKKNPLTTMSYVKIIDTDTNKTVVQTNSDNSPVVCVTDKINPANGYKNFIQNDNRIQYYTYGRHVYFSKPITPNQKIEINYPSLDSKIRVKAILRRNTKHDMWVTPVLKGYTVYMTTL